MTRPEYPALYHSADDLSNEQQAVFVGVVLAHLLLLVLAAILSAVARPSPTMAIAQALVLLGTLGCSVYLVATRPDRVWYGARAVAESIKTATWRFVTSAEPFDNATLVDRDRFRELLKAIIDQNRQVTQRLTKLLDGAQITQSMLATREMGFGDRLELYLQARVSEQQSWYARKAAYNSRMAKRFSIALIVVNALAVASAISRVANASAAFWPTDIFLAASASILAWLQTKRFSELASSYALAAHEIGLIKEQAASITSDAALSKFVGDAENAFSREHTQWVARKDE